MFLKHPPNQRILHRPSLLSPQWHQESHLRERHPQFPLCFLISDYLQLSLLRLVAPSILPPRLQVMVMTTAMAAAAVAAAATVIVKLMSDAVLNATFCCREIAFLASSQVIDADGFDPFSPARSISQLLNLMDQLMEDPFRASRGFGAGSRGGWDVREEDSVLYLRINMPGLGKGDVKVAVDQNTLIIRGEGGKKECEEESGWRYSSHIDLPWNQYKVDEMKNGILKVVVPKVKEEERNDVFHVQVV